MNKIKSLVLLLVLAIGTISAQAYTFSGQVFWSAGQCFYNTRTRIYVQNVTTSQTWIAVPNTWGYWNAYNVTGAATDSFLVTGGYVNNSCAAYNHIEGSYHGFLLSAQGDVQGLDFQIVDN